MTRSQPTTGTEAAERVADVLLAFSDGEDSMGVSALARQLNLSKAVVHRILQSLVSRGLVAFDESSREYSLGSSAIALGARALRQNDVRSASRQELTQLRDATDETTTLSLLSGDKRTYVDQFESPQEIKMTVELGRRYPLYAGASSRAILAHLPESVRQKIVHDRLDSLTPETITDSQSLAHALMVIREVGYARSKGERQAGAGSVAAPLFDAHGEVIGSISVCGPLARFDDEAVARFTPLVVDAAARISARLARH